MWFRVNFVQRMFYRFYRKVAVWTQFLEAMFINYLIQLL
jgi:hypothetical protein